MSDITLCVVEAFPVPKISSLRRQVFADFEPSALLTEVLSSESALRDENSKVPNHPFRVAAFRGDVLVGWTYGYREGTGSRSCQALGVMRGYG